MRRYEKNPKISFDRIFFAFVRTAAESGKTFGGRTVWLGASVRASFSGYSEPRADAVPLFAPLFARSVRPGA